MNRQVWIDQPKDADVLKLKANLITNAVFDARWLAGLADPLQYLARVRNSLGGAGAYFCAQGADSLGAWPSWRTTTGPEWADWAYDLLQHKIAPGTSGSFPVAHLNPECDDVSWQLAMLKRWRTHSPKRFTVWSPISHKANVFRPVGPELAKLVDVVAPQCYSGAMERVESSNEVLAWISIGIPPLKVWPFLDGAALGQWWGEVGGAVVFTQGRIP